MAPIVSAIGPISSLPSSNPVSGSPQCSGSTSLWWLKTALPLDTYKVDGCNENEMTENQTAKYQIPRSGCQGQGAREHCGVTSAIGLGTVVLRNQSTSCADIPYTTQCRMLFYSQSTCTGTTYLSARRTDNSLIDRQLPVPKPIADVRGSSSPRGVSKSIPYRLDLRRPFASLSSDSPSRQLKLGSRSNY